MAITIKTKESKGKTLKVKFNKAILVSVIYNDDLLDNAKPRDEYKNLFLSVE
jgi:hypothetical protein